MRIAFAGNPNSGKTTMYNALTGSNEHVGNWAGVTVDKKEAFIKKVYSCGQEIIAVDLPGAYSMSPFTAEESVTRDYIHNEHVDVIVNIVDATNLSRSLFFTTQLLELGVPVVVALNKTDINIKKNTIIDTMALSWRLGCPVVETVSTDSDSSDLAEVIRTAISLKGKVQTAPYHQGDVTFPARKLLPRRTGSVLLLSRVSSVKWKNERSLPEITITRTRLMQYLPALWWACPSLLLSCSWFSIFLNLPLAPGWQICWLAGLMASRLGSASCLSMPIRYCTLCWWTALWAA